MSFEPITVLVADDDTAIRGLVRAVLRDEVYEIDEAKNGDEAVNRLRQKRYDAVILDLMMGPGSGFDVLDTVHECRPGEKIVIVVSATSQPVINQLDTENVFTKLRKPFDVYELLLAVRTCCAHSSVLVSGSSS